MFCLDHSVKRKKMLALQSNCECGQWYDWWSYCTDELVWWLGTEILFETNCGKELKVPHWRFNDTFSSFAIDNGWIGLIMGSFSGLFRHECIDVFSVKSTCSMKGLNFKSTWKDETGRFWIGAHGRDILIVTERWGHGWASLTDINFCVYKMLPNHIPVLPSGFHALC